MDNEQNYILMATSQTRKRDRTPSSGSDHCKLPHLDSPRAWPRFLIITGVDDQLRNLSPIKICKEISSLLGEVEDTRRLRDGSLLIHVANDSQSEKLQDITDLAGLPLCQLLWLLIAVLTLVRV